MALKKPVPPPATRKAFQAGLAEMIRLGRAPKGLPSEDFPQQIYALGLRNIIRGPNLRGASHVAWEFIVGTPSGPAVSVYVGHPPKGVPPKMTSLARDPIATEALQATRAVERLPETRSHDYELRRLRIPGLSVGAFWLKSLEGGPDLVVPYHAVAHKLKTMRAYSMDEFMSIVRPLAEKRLKFDDSARSVK